MADEEVEHLIVDPESENITKPESRSSTVKPKAHQCCSTKLLVGFIIVACLILYWFGESTWPKISNDDKSDQDHDAGFAKFTDEGESLTVVPTSRHPNNIESFTATTSQPTSNIKYTSAPQPNHKIVLQTQYETCPKRVTEVITCPNGRTEQEGNLQYVRCIDCVKGLSSLNKTYYASKEEKRNTKPIYMPILVPPFFGSSILSQILASSPSVSSMCKKENSRKGNKVPWQCESTWLLIRERVFAKGHRWLPEYTNWTTVYKIYKEIQPWSNPGAPILMDKAPPNIAKSKGLIEFYEKNDMDYRIIVMWRHPCRKEWIQNRKRNYTKYLEEILEYVPSSKRFLINYDDLISRPCAVVKALLNFFPTLYSLSLNEEALTSEKEDDVDSDSDNRRVLKGAHGTLATFIPSDECKISLTDETKVDPAAMKVWRKFEQQISI